MVVCFPVPENLSGKHNSGACHRSDPAPEESPLCRLSCRPSALDSPKSANRATPEPLTRILAYRNYYENLIYAANARLYLRSVYHHGLLADFDYVNIATRYERLLAT